MINIDKLTNSQKIDLVKDKLLNAFLMNYPNLQKEIFEKLSVDKYWYVRVKLARNPNLPVDIMEKLAVDGSNSVKYWLTENPSYQKYLLDKENKI